MLCKEKYNKSKIYNINKNNLKSKNLKNYQEINHIQTIIIYRKIQKKIKFKQKLLKIWDRNRIRSR